MNVKTGRSSTELFGGEVPDDVRALVNAAKAGPREAACSVLWTALALAPDCLPVYYLLYKAHAGRGELSEAERAARAALAVAGAQAGLPTRLDATGYLSAVHADFATPGPARFWLFTLKALAFICVRRGEVELARGIVDSIGRCDPTHSVGSEVTALLVGAARAVEL
jgi:hypothetical protein